jgi:hypothetical protein
MEDQNFETGSDSLPIGPKTPYEVEPGEGDAHVEDPTEPWRYEQTFPVNAYLKHNRHVDPHVEGINPYAAIGLQANLRLRFRDVYGNRMPGEIEYGLPIRYFDPIIPLGEWPAVSSHFAVQLDGTISVLNITLRFDLDAISIDPRFREDARATLCRAAHQLSGPGTRVRLVAPLIADGSVEIEPTRIVEDFLRPAISAIDGGRPTQPMEINVPIQVNSDTQDRMAIDVVLETCRDDCLIDPAFETLPPEIQGASTQVRMARSIIPAGISIDANTQEDRPSALRRFADDFEAALPDWKLATATLEPGVVSLWAVRRSLVRFEPQSGEAIYYAPRPISNELWSGTVSSRKGGEVLRKVVDLDVDRHAAAFLEVIDKVTKGEVASAVGRLNRDAFTEIMRDHRSIADRFAELTQPIIVDSAPTSPELKANAQELIRQRVLRTAAAAYSLETVVQVRVNVSNRASEPIRLFGAVEDGRATLSTAKVSIVPGNDESSLTFGFDVPVTEEAQNVMIPGATFRVTHVEHTIEAEADTAYERSSWLTLVKGEPITIGQQVVPIPLRSFPTAPVLKRHADISEWQFDSPLRDVDEWRYEFEYDALLAAQDTLRSDPGINFAPATARAFRVARPLPEALFEFSLNWEPRYSTPGQSLSERFESVVPAARLFDQGDTNHPDVQQAIASIRDLHELVRGVTVADWYWRIPSGVGGALLPEADDVQKTGPTESQWEKFVKITNTLRLRNERSASGAVQITRNDNLLPNRETNPAFVYATPPVRFPNPLIPIINRDEPFKISVLHGTEPTQGLAMHLSAAQNELFGDTLPERRWTTRWEVRLLLDPRGRPVNEESYKPDGFLTEQPVLLIPHWEIELARDADVTRQDGLANYLSSRLKAWAVERSVSCNGAFRFDMTVFETAEGIGRIPTLRVARLWVPIGDI